MKLLVIFLVCAFTNFLWEAFKDHDWYDAAKLTYFQGVALLCVGLVD